MAARTIVTFHPDVACDLCGRRLLRGERPDVFLGGGQRRTVCELCAPRATHEGWRREADAQIGSPRTRRPPRGRSLLGRLRQLREPVQEDGRPLPDVGAEPGSRVLASEDAGTGSEWAEIDGRWTGIDDGWAGVPENGLGEAADGETPAALPGEHESIESSSADRARAPGSDERGGGRMPLEAEVRRALAVFNAGESPRRVAGVTRSLGAACVRAAPVTDGVVSIVVAWELCWYRYEIDLDDEAAGVRIAAEGMELEELPAEDRVANTAADEHGMLSLLAS
jgi:hypothetical protein